MTLTHINSGNYQKEVKESKLPVIIDFYADWCGPCRMMAPLFEELSETYKGRLKFAKLNTDEENAIAGQYGISGIPCLVVVYQGKEAGRIVGYVPKAMLEQKIDAILAAKK